MKKEKLANNQYIIIDDTGERRYKSYNSYVILWSTEGIILDSKTWNYSKTTNKYRSRLLQESTARTQNKIDTGEYKLVDLNGGLSPEKLPMGIGRKKPYVAQTDGDSGVFKCPMLGDVIPSGWQVSEVYFVDSSGFGAEAESALTAGQFLGKIKAGHGYGILEAGQFQVYIREYTRI